MKLRVMLILMGMFALAPAAFAMEKDGQEVAGLPGATECNEQIKYQNVVDGLQHQGGTPIAGTLTSRAID